VFTTPCPKVQKAILATFILSRLNHTYMARFLPINLKVWMSNNYLVEAGLESNLNTMELQKKLEIATGLQIRILEVILKIASCRTT
jgi:hypothetical protein